MSKKHSSNVKFTSDTWLGKNSLIEETSNDPLTQLRNEQLRHKINEIKRMEADIYLQEREAELNRLKAKTNVKQTVKQESDHFIQELLTNPQLQQTWLNYTDQQRATIISTAQAMKAGGTSQQGISMWIPLMMGQLNQKPDTSVKEMVELIKAVAPQQQGIQMKDIVELMKLNQQQPKQDEPNLIREVIGVINQVYNGMNQTQQQLWTERIQHMQEQQVSPLDYLKEMKAFQESMGINPNTANPQLQLEIEKLRSEREFKLVELQNNMNQQNRMYQLEDKKWTAEREDGQRQQAMIEKFLDGPLMSHAGKVIEQMGGAAASRISGQPVTQQPLNPQQYMIQCGACGGTFTAPAGQKTYECANCKTQIPAEKLFSPTQTTPNNTQASTTPSG